MILEAGPRKIKGQINRHRLSPRQASNVGLVVKNLPANAGDIREAGSIPGLGRSPGRHSNLFQYSCLENPINKRSLAGYGPSGHRVGHD